MTNQDIAKALNTTVEKVEQAIVGMGDINASMLPSIGEKIHGGKLAPVDKKDDAPIVPAKTSTKARRQTKKEKEAAALTVQREAAVATVNQQVKQAVQPQVIQNIDDNASIENIVDSAQTSIAIGMMQDVQELGALLTPEMRALKTVNGAQQYSKVLSAQMQANGITVDAIVAAAVPQRKERVSLDDMLATEMAALGVKVA